MVWLDSNRIAYIFMVDTVVEKMVKTIDASEPTFWWAEPSFSNLKRKYVKQCKKQSMTEYGPFSINIMTGSSPEDLHLEEKLFKILQKARNSKIFKKKPSRVFWP